MQPALQLAMTPRKKNSGEARVGAQHVMWLYVFAIARPTSALQFNSGPSFAEGEGGRVGFSGLDKHPFGGRPLFNFPESFERFPLEAHGVWSARF